MIKNVYGNSAWISVGGAGTSLPWINTTQPMAGMLRSNPSVNRIEVYDGQNWVSIGNDTHIDLSESAKETLTWARKKMEEEKQLTELMEKHPGLKDLHDKFKMMKILCQEEEKKNEMV
jgi:hypothetical protein